MVSSVDRESVGRAFSHAADSYVENSVLQVQVGEWLLEGLSYAPSYLDVGCGMGYMAEQLQFRALAERVVGLDCSWKMLIQQANKHNLVCADMSVPPFACDSFHQLTSNLALHWVKEPVQLLVVLLSLLKSGGSLSFSVPALGSLQELSQSWKCSDDTYQHVNTFNCAREWREISLSALRQLNLKSEVQLEQREFVRWFATPYLAIKSLRDVGANFVTTGANQGLTGKTCFAAMLRAYEALRQEQGIPMTYQVLRLKISLED